MEDPDCKWTDQSTEEEPVQCCVVAKRPENPLGSHQTPDNRCIEEDALAGACPRTVCWKEILLTYILDGV